jgi:hypothetical protein
MMYLDGLTSVAEADFRQQYRRHKPGIYACSTRFWGTVTLELL